MKLIGYPMFLTLSLAIGSAVAAPPDSMTKSIMLQEKATTGEQFKNESLEQQLQHRVNENDPEQAKKAREMKQEQQDKQSKHQYQYQEKSPGQHMNQSGSMMGGSGAGGGGGGRR
jgi:predicted  nucleic acid-binding Zn ribbon protein